MADPSYIALPAAIARSGYSRRHIERKIESGDLPAVKIKGKTHVLPDDLDRVFAPQPIPTKAARVADRDARAADLAAAVASGRAAGEKLALTPLTPDQRALLATVLAPLRKIGGAA